MAANESSFKIWSVDNVVYGPVDIQTLEQWIMEERIPATMWIYDCRVDLWQKAEDMSVLQPFFTKLAKLQNDNPTNGDIITTSAANLRVGVLRRMKILAHMEEPQLISFTQYVSLYHAKQFSTIVKQNDPGDAMFLILEGEVRVRFMVGNKETTLATLYSGDFFGELCLFDHGPRSADVVANEDTHLLRITAASFQQMLAQNPSLAAPFLSAVCKTLAARMRADNKRLRDSILFSRASHGQ